MNSEKKKNGLTLWLGTHWYMLAVATFSFGGLVATWTFHIADTSRHLDVAERTYIAQIQRIDARQQVTLDAQQLLSRELSTIHGSTIALQDEVRQLREEIRELRRVVDRLQGGGQRNSP